jgi:hypothetical protein
MFHTFGTFTGILIVLAYYFTSLYQYFWGYMKDVSIAEENLRNTLMIIAFNQADI